MIVEPVPTSPRSPLRRLVGMARVALPIVALVAVTGGAVLGQAAESPAEPRNPEAATAAPETPAETPAATPAEGTLAGEPADYPGVILGIPVRTVTATLAARGDGRLRGLVAVSGYLSVRELPAECADRYLGPLGPACERRATLADLPQAPVSATGNPGVGPHLHPQLPAGVRLPRQVAQASGGAPARPLAVVVVARFDDPRADACAAGGRHCGQELVVERVAWADGEVYPRTSMVDPALGVNVFDDSWRVRQSVARTALGQARPLLASAYLTPASLQAVDPAAAQRLHETGVKAPAAVWYVRGLEVAFGPPGARAADAPPPRIRWVVVDDATGEVLVSGGEPTIPD